MPGPAARSCRAPAAPTMLPPEPGHRAVLPERDGSAEGQSSEHDAPLHNPNAAARLDAGVARMIIHMAWAQHNNKAVPCCCPSHTPHNTCHGPTTRQARHVTPSQAPRLRQRRQGDVAHALGGGDRPQLRGRQAGGDGDHAAAHPDRRQGHRRDGRPRASQHLQEDSILGFKVNSKSACNVSSDHAAGGHADRGQRQSRDGRPRASWHLQIIGCA